MTERYIVEFGGQAYGILELREGALVFHATDQRVSTLDGQTYADAGAALLAVEQAVRGQAA